MSSLPNAFPAFKQLNKAGTKGNVFALILDASGSMSNLIDDTIGGVNSLIEEQKKDPIKSLFRIIKFEGSDIKTIRNGYVDEIEPITRQDYTAVGSTNLLDAIGETIKSIDLYLENIREQDRPSVIIQITTDGQENSSKKYTKSMIKALIEDATSKNWIVSYVGAGIDAFAEASQFGIDKSAISVASRGAVSGTYASLNSSITRMKSFVESGMTASAMYSNDLVYSDLEREMMVKGAK